MNYDEAQAIADSLNAKDAGVLHYTVISVGNAHDVLVQDMEGNELGLL